MKNIVVLRLSLTSHESMSRENLWYFWISYCNFFHFENLVSGIFHSSWDLENKSQLERLNLIKYTLVVVTWLGQIIPSRHLKLACIMRSWRRFRLFPVTGSGLRLLVPCSISCVQKTWKICIRSMTCITSKDCAHFLTSLFFFYPQSRSQDLLCFQIGGAGVETLDEAEKILKKSWTILSRFLLLSGEWGEGLIQNFTVKYSQWYIYRELQVLQ